MKSNSKIVSIILLFTIFCYIGINIFNVSEVEALTILTPKSRREQFTDVSQLTNYPGYADLIAVLQESHPNWGFTILYTGLDWNEVLQYETVVNHGTNLVDSKNSSTWFCPVCGSKAYDNGSWRCASETAVAYYIDPRNSLNESYIFQMETLSYNAQNQNIDGVKAIISDVAYMQTDTITYTKTDGTTGVIEKSYAQVIMEAAQEANISPYHLAARIRQEQGTGSTPSVLARGTYEGYVGYYNFLNIRASGNTTLEIITKGLDYAKSKELTDPEKSIKQGALFLASGYISTGQDTLYLQKFDVDDSDNSIYVYQYMQSLSATKSEGNEVKESYKSLGMLNNAFNFVIPVYENMPEYPCPYPVAEGITTQNVKVKGDSVRVRETASANATVLATVNTGDDLLRIEIATSEIDGYYWDKVVLADGRKGYVARNFLVEVPDITNCNDVMITKSSVNLRNGPGTTNTTIIATLSENQMLTRIETGKYYLNGYYWDRVVLQDGRQGYIAQEFITYPSSSEGTEGNVQEIIRVICKSGLKVRVAPGTTSAVKVYLSQGDLLTRTQKAVETGTYIWDKVVTNNGIEGYIARGDATEDYIEVVSTVTVPTTPDPEENTNPETGNNTEENTKIVLEESNLLCEPSITIENVISNYSDKTVTIKNANNEVITSGNIGTGYTIIIDDKTYTTVKVGDTNGDGKISSADYVRIKNVILGKVTPTDAQKLAVDANRDGKISSADYVRIKNFILGKASIKVEKEN